MAFSPSTFTTMHSQQQRDIPLFHPPKSPASTYTDPAVALAGMDYFSQGSRKRQRADSQTLFPSPQHRSSTLLPQQRQRPAYQRNFYSSRSSNLNATTPAAQRTHSWQQLPTPGEEIFGSAQSSFVNEKYHLAGGYDTPGQIAASHHDRPIFSSFATTTAYDQGNVLRRRLRGEDDSDTRQDRGESHLLEGPLARERNGAARMHNAFAAQGCTAARASPSTTWTGLAFSLVGKVFNFGTNVVKGFYAGGGRGYDLNGNSEQDFAGSSTLRGRMGQKSPPLPGAWDNGGDSDAEFLGDFEQDNPTFTPSPSTRPQAKRRQTDRDTWIMVGGANGASHAAAMPTAISNSPTRNASLANMRPPTAHKSTASIHQKPQSRRGTLLAPITTAFALSAATATAAAQSSPMSTATPTAQAPFVPGHNRRASTASMRSSFGGGRHHSRHNSGNSDSFLHSPLLSPEASRLARRQAKQERATDKAMSNMGRRMEEMIRQAQEALGTKVEISSSNAADDGGAEEGWEDEGFVDQDDWSH